MKKHDEGYILAYVFVILTVICLIAVSVLTIPLTNLKLQHASVKRMQAQYAAQGLIEEALTQVSDNVRMYKSDYGSVTTATDAQSGISSRIQTTIKDVTIGELSWSSREQTVGEDKTEIYSCKFPVTAVCGTVKVTCEVELKNAFTKSGVCTIESPVISYVSYQISNITEGGVPNAG